MVLFGVGLWVGFVGEELVFFFVFVNFIGLYGVIVDKICYFIVYYIIDYMLYNYYIVEIM